MEKIPHSNKIVGFYPQFFEVIFFNNCLTTNTITKTYTLELNEEKHSWLSPALGINVDMLTFGTKGFPLILFPTSMGMHNENRDFKLVESIGWFIESGLIKVYCPDSIDWNGRMRPIRNR